MFDDVEWTLSDYMSAHAANRGESLAAVAGDTRLTWAEFDRRTAKVAAALALSGCKAGDRIAIVMANEIAGLEAMVGAMRAGMIAVPLNTTLTDDTIARLIVDAGAALLVASAGFSGRFDAVPSSVVRILDGGAKPGWLDYRSWRDGAPATEPPRVDPSAPCNIIYSSGTTGTPKGIVHTHRGRIDWAYDLAIALRYGEGARCLIVTGLYSNISWAGILGTIVVGGTLVVHQHFDAGTTLAEIERSGITNVSMVPLQYQRLLDHPDFASTDTRSMRAMMCCGSPLPASTKQRLLETFDCGVTELYGLTEGIATTLQPEEAAGRLASVGRPVAGNEFRLVDESGRVVATGETGEIVARSRFATSGYWNNPAATEAATWIDAAGRSWLRTGDIGRFDGDGYLYVVDRKKDMILSGGQNVYPADLESVLYDHPAVAECAVIGVPHDEWGETPVALVKTRPDDAITAEEIRLWANARLGRQQRISRLDFVGELPRNANGKILKNVLRDAYP